jgi:hypothetical protein
MQTDLRYGVERSHQICDELGKAAHEREIKEALNARGFNTSQILGRLDECFRLIGEINACMTRLSKTSVRS